MEEVINAKQMYMPPKKLEPKVDEVVSKVVGKKVLARDPRLIKLVVKWKQKKRNPKTQDNFLNDPEKVKELREVFNSSKL